MERHLLAVMPDVESAEHLARVLVDDGIDTDRIRVADVSDEADALRAEMAAETTDSVIAPQAVYVASKEGNRGAILVSLVGSALAVVVAALVAFIDVGLDYWARFAIEAAFLVFMTVLIGYMVGASWAWDPEHKMAAERGVVVRVADASSRTAAIIIDADPIRVDEVSAVGGPVASVHHEGADVDAHVVPKVSDTVDRIRHSDPTTYH